MSSKQNNDDHALVRLVYTSTETKTFTAVRMLQLLSQARENNKALGVTGVLLYDMGNFFQVLEGPRQTIEALFERVMEDTRHTNIVKLILEPADSRLFEEWSMGASIISPDLRRRFEGLNDFFTDGKCLHDLDASNARDLLMAFKDGKWRTIVRDKDDDFHALQ